MKKINILKVLEKASREVSKWPEWKRSPDVEAIMERLKLYPDQKEPTKIKTIKNLKGK